MIGALAAVWAGIKPAPTKTPPQIIEILPVNPVDPVKNSLFPRLEFTVAGWIVVEGSAGAFEFEGC